MEGFQKNPLGIVLIESVDYVREIYWSVQIDLAFQLCIPKNTALLMEYTSENTARITDVVVHLPNTMDILQQG